MQEITSASNPRIRGLVRLQRKADERARTGTFIIEGERQVLDADRGALEEIYITRGTFERLKPKLQSRVSEDQIILLSESAMAKASDTKSPQGILAVARIPLWNMEDLLPGRKDLLSDREGPLPDREELQSGREDPLPGRKNPLLVVLEDIQDPGNLGTIFRTAEAAGVSGLILSKGTVDVFNPKTVRATMSSIFEVPFIVSDDLPSVIRCLQGSSIRFHAACLQRESASYESMDYRGPSAFIIGNEARGLREETIRAADDAVHIPMQGRIESLNAAISAGILLYEADRQRRRTD